MNDEQITENLTDDLLPDANTLDYSGSLTTINDAIDLNNSIMAGQLLFFGIICGLIFMHIFWSRFK